MRSKKKRNPGQRVSLALLPILSLLLLCTPILAAEEWDIPLALKLEEGFFEDEEEETLPSAQEAPIEAVEEPFLSEESLLNLRRPRHRLHRRPHRCCRER